MAAGWNWRTRACDIGSGFVVRAGNRWSFMNTLAGEQWVKFQPDHRFSAIADFEVAMLAGTTEQTQLANVDAVESRIFPIAYEDRSGVNGVRLESTVS
jgi:hypothetical protein